MAEVNKKEVLVDNEADFMKSLKRSGTGSPTAMSSVPYSMDRTGLLPKEVEEEASTEETEATETESTEESTENSSEDVPSTISDDASDEDEVDDAPETEQASSKSGSRESLEVRDAKGYLKKIEIDFANKTELRNYVKKSFDLERGMRKMQVERDRANERVTSLEDRATKWDNLSKVWDGGDVATIVDTYFNKPGSFDALVAQRAQEYEELKDASPEAVEALKFKRRTAELERELREVREGQTAAQTRAQAERTQSEDAKLSQLIETAKKKYSFAGRLGNPDTESFYDESVERRVRDIVRELKEEEIGIDRDLVMSEFRRVHDLVSGTLNKKAKQEVTKLITKNKSKAQGAVRSQVEASTGGSDKSIRQEYLKLLSEGKLSEIWANPKFGSML